MGLFGTEAYSSSCSREGEDGDPVGASMSLRGGVGWGGAEWGGVLGGFSVGLFSSS